MTKSAALVAALSLLVPIAPLAAPHRSARTPSHGAAHAARSQDPLHVQLARAVFPHERWERLVAKASLELTQRLAQASQGHFQLDPEFADRLREEYERMAPYEELIGVQARILDRQYSSAELKQLLAFYRSPLGKRSVLLLHDLTSYSDLQMQQRVHAGIGDALNRLKPLVHPVSPGGDDASPGGGTSADATPADRSGGDVDQLEL